MLAQGDLDSTVVARVAAASAGVGSLEVTEWDLDSVKDAFNDTTKGLFRASGKGTDGTTVVPWSVVLKLIGPTDGVTVWDREARVYESGLLHDVVGIRAPRCFGVDWCAGPSAWIWLEDVGNTCAAPWPVSRYEQAARRLGEFNGAYHSGHPLPRGAWLPRGAAAAIDDRAPAFTMLAALRDHDMVIRCWPGGLVDRVAGLWQERGVLLAALDRLPQTMCHLDAFPRNLLWPDDSNDLVAVDWSYSGIAAVGSELGPLVAASACMFDMDPGQLERIEAACCGPYIDGLRAAGWRGDERIVRLGYTASVGLRYGLYPMGVLLADDNVRSRYEQYFGLHASDIADRWAEIAGFLLDRVDEARQLLALEPVA